MKIIIRDVHISEKDENYIKKICNPSEVALEIVCNKKLKSNYVLEILKLFLKYIFSLEDDAYSYVTSPVVEIQKQNLSFILYLSNFKKLKKMYRLDIKDSLLISQSALKTNCKIITV